MDPGFTQANSTNLPQVDVDMVTQFFINNAEMTNIKTQKSIKEAYGDNVICYVQVKREGGICIVRAKITPEYKIRKKPYRVEVNVDKNNEKVISCSCIDCAALAGDCKPIFWLHQHSAEPSITSVECYWKASKLSKVGASENFVCTKHTQIVII